MLKHLISKGSTQIWSYGSVGMTITSLEMVDTFRLSPPDGDTQLTVGQGINKHPLAMLGLQVREVRADGGLGTDSFWDSLLGWCTPRWRQPRGAIHQEPLDEVELSSREEVLWRGYHKLPHVSGRAEYAHVHQDPSYRSALEVVVRHEVEAYHYGNEDVWGDKIFEDLIAEKWENFARGYHIWYHLVPCGICVLVFMLVLFTRTSSVYQEAVGSTSPWYFWMDNTLFGFPFTPNQAQKILCPVFYGIVTPYLIISAFREGRFQQTDWDPNEDLVLDFSEGLFFVFKNIGSIINLILAIALVCLAILWQQTPDGADFIARGTLDAFAWETHIFSLCTLFFWCKFLHTLLPFRQIGTVLIPIWRMLLSDVFRWMVVFFFLLLGFATASYTLELEKRITMGPTDDVEELDGFATFLILYAYVSLGEVSGTGDYGHTWMMLLHLSFVIMSTLLMLNLIIAMMGKHECA